MYILQCGAVEGVQCVLREDHRVHCLLFTVYCLLHWALGWVQCVMRGDDPAKIGRTTSEGLCQPSLGQEGGRGGNISALNAKLEFVPH